jgi:hypothetical protein
MAYTEAQLKKRAEQSKAWRERNKEHTKATDKAYREKDPEHQRNRRKKHREENVEATRESRKAYRENNPEKVAISDIKRRYFLSDEIATDLYIRSMQHCESCGALWGNHLKQRFCVDHDHDTGRVRGILCMPCNAALGLLREDTEVVLALAEYSRKHNGSTK